MEERVGWGKMIKKKTTPHTSYFLLKHIFYFNGKYDNINIKRDGKTKQKTSNFRINNLPLKKTNT